MIEFISSTLLLLIDIQLLIIINNMTTIYTLKDVYNFAGDGNVDELIDI